VSDAVGVGLVVLDLWRRLPPEHRRRVVVLVRTQTPRLAGGAARIGRRVTRRG
jgi:hypothetical protein